MLDGLIAADKEVVFIGRSLGGYVVEDYALRGARRLIPRNKSGHRPLSCKACRTSAMAATSALAPSVFGALFGPIFFRTSITSASLPLEINHRGEGGIAHSPTINRAGKMASSACCSWA